MTSDYVRICDLPDLQPGDLLWVARENAGGEIALFVTSGDPLTGWFVDRFVAKGEIPATGWKVSHRTKGVKVLRRLRDVTREEIGRWDETHARLLAAPDLLSARPPPKVGDVVHANHMLPEGACVQSTNTDHVWRRVGAFWQSIGYNLAEGVPTPDATLKVGDPLGDLKKAPVGTFAETPRSDGRTWGFLKTDARWVMCSPENRNHHGYGSLDEYMTGADEDPDLKRATVTAFLPPEITTRRAVVEWLAAHGHEGAKRRMAAEHGLPKPLKVGDKIGSQAELDALPPGAVVEMFDGVWQHATGGNWRPVSLSYDNWSHPMSSTRFGLLHDSKAKLVALDVLADDRVSFARALAAQGYEPAAKALRDRPPVPKPGDKLTAADLDALPVGAVVDDGDRGIPWNIKTATGWRMMGRSLSEEGSFSGLKCLFSHDQNLTLVALDAPHQDTGVLRRWAAARGYAPAIRYEAEKKALDGRAEQVQTQDMPTQQPQPQTITLIPQAGESAAAFQERVRKSCDALAKVTSFARADEVAQSVVPQQLPSPAPSLLARLGASMRATGAGLGREVLDRAKVKAVHVGIDGARGALHVAITELAEALAGEETALKIARVVQLPSVHVAEDFLLSVGADLAGRPALAAVARDRFAERAVDGVADVAVNHVVRIGSRAVAALRGADQAATTAIEGSPVSAGQVGEAQS